MFDFLLFIGICSLNLLGLAFLSLLIERHWKGVSGSGSLKYKRIALTKCLGYLLLGTSLAMTLYFSEASLGVILWISLLAVCGISLAMILAWRSQWLLPIALLIAKKI